MEKAWHQEYEPEGQAMATVMKYRKMNADGQFTSRFYSVQYNSPRDHSLECVFIMSLQSLIDKGN